MGRPRKPTALKILEGDQPCRINRAEPLASTPLGDPPGHLDVDASVVWTRLASSFESLGLVTATDADALALYCSAYSRAVACRKAIADEGLVISTQSGDRPNPHLGILESAEKTMVRLMIQFGMTPSSRSALHVAAPVQEDPLFAFLAGKTTSNASQKGKTPSKKNSG